MKPSRTLSLAILAMLCASPVRSEPIVFSFTGHVAATNKPAVFPINQPIVGEFAFESTTPDANPGNPEQGHYSGALTYFQFTSGSYSVRADEANSANSGGDILVNRASVFDEYQYQVFLIRSTFQTPPWGPDVGNEQLVRMWLRLIDANRLAPASETLPLTPPSLSDYTSTTFGLIFEADPTGDPGIVYQLDTLESGPPSPVESGSWGLLKTLYR